MLERSNRFAVLISLIFLSNPIFAQNENQVRELKEKFPEEEVAFEEFKTTYSYFLDKTSGLLRVKQQDIVQLISLKSSASLVWPVFYNDEIEIGDFQLKNEKRRKHTFQKFCSHQGQSRIFHSDAKICTYSFYFGPTGTRLNLTSDLIFKDPRYFARVPLQEFLPGKKRVVEFVWPESVEVELVEFYLDSTFIRRKSIQKDDYVGFRYEWEWPNSIPPEDDKPHYSNYVPHIIPLTKSYMPSMNAPKVEVLGSAKDLYNWYQELAEGVDNESSEVQNLVHELIAGKNEDEQVKAIYYWVQDNIKYIAFENGIMGFRPDDAGAVLEKKYGDCKGMANLLKSMLLEAGFDARLTWLGTNSLPYTYDIPSLGVDNHMVCTLITDEDEFLVLDATVKFNELNYSPFHIQGKQILIEDGEEFRIETIPFEEFDGNYEKYVGTSAIEGDELVGEGQYLLDGDAKQFFLMALSRIEKKDHAKFTRSLVSYHGLTDGITTDFTGSNRSDTVQISVKSRFQNKIQTFGDETYVEIEQRKEFADLKIDKKRKAPFDFGRKRMVINKLAFEIPQGYIISNLPETFRSINDNLDFKASFEVKDGYVHYDKKLILKKAILLPKEFSDWNDSIEKLISFYSQPIILKRND